MEEEKPEYIRRERYKGTHPKAFKEKYKELKPDLYASDIEKVIAQGKTPAGMHRPICVTEIMDFLSISPGQVGMDATLGYGGHSLEILKRLQPGGHLFATDVDPFELPRTRDRLESLGFGSDILTVKKLNFSNIDLIVEESGLLNFVLADLGVSSMQIDNPERGFSVKVDGPLDLRLNPRTGKSAAAFLKTVTSAELEEILRENSDEPYSEIIADFITSELAGGLQISTTTQLREIIFEALTSQKLGLNKDEMLKSCQRCFQALRIEVNNEFEVLEQFLDKLPDSLAPGGRVAILSFHSGEDRRVKKSFRYFFREGIYGEIAPDPIRASPEECFTNRRAKSAKLRWAIKA